MTKMKPRDVAEQTIHAPVVRHPRLLLFALALGGFAIGLTEFATMSLVPYIAQGLGISEPQAGHLVSAYALGVVIGAPTIAVAAARMNRRTLLLALMGAFAAGHVATTLAQSYAALLVWRFASGVPHGAYFGIGALVASSLVSREKRAQAVGMMMVGLTVACTIGVPLASWLGQAVGWRSCFALVAGLASATVLLIALYLPRRAAESGDASPLAELQALASLQVWLTLLMGAIGFGGLFAVYTYMASTLMEVTQVSDKAVPLILALFGVGMTVGNLVVPRFAGGRLLMPGIAAMLLWSAVMLVLFPLAARQLWSIALVAVGIGIGGAVGALMQVRLMDVARRAQSMAGALNNSAFNAANALGPFLGGLAIQAGYGWTSTGWVGSILALGGLCLWWLSWIVEKRMPEHRLGR